MATAAAIEKRLASVEREATKAAGVCLTCGTISTDRWLARLAHKQIAAAMEEQKLDRAGAIAWICALSLECAGMLDKADLTPAPDEPVPCRANANERRTIEQTGKCPACGQRVHWSGTAIAAMRPVVEQQIALVMREKDVSRADAIAFIADCSPYVRPCLDALE